MTARLFTRRREPWHVGVALVHGPRAFQRRGWYRLRRPARYALMTLPTRAPGYCIGRWAPTPEEWA